MKFVLAVNTFFGRKENQTLSEFRDELKVLTDKDRDELALMLSAHFGEPIEVTHANGEVVMIG